MNYLAHLDKIGKPRQQQRHINWILTHLSKHADLTNTQQIDEYISTIKRTDAYKRNITQVYSAFCNFDRIPYKPKKFTNIANKPIRIPTEEKINMIIANSGRILATKLTLSKDTGLRPVEVHTLKVKDIDFDQHLVYPTTAKHGNPRTLKISNNLASLLLTHIIKKKLKPNDQVFNGTADHYGTAFERTRNRLADKLNDPTLKTIRLYDLRHFFATMLYHKTREILIVKQQLGHKYIENTLVYIDLEATLFNLTDDYITKAVQTKEEAIKLLDNGFTYIQTIDGYHLYRKRK